MRLIEMSDEVIYDYIHDLTQERYDKVLGCYVYDVEVGGESFVGPRWIYNGLLDFMKSAAKYFIEKRDTDVNMGHPRRPPSDHPIS